MLLEFVDVMARKELAQKVAAQDVKAGGGTGGLNTRLSIID